MTYKSYRIYLVTGTWLNLLEWILIVTVLLFGLRLSNLTHGDEHIFLEFFLRILAKI